MSEQRSLIPSHGVPGLRLWQAAAAAEGRAAAAEAAVEAASARAEALQAEQERLRDQLAAAREVRVVPISK